MTLGRGALSAAALGLLLAAGGARGQYLDLTTVEPLDIVDGGPQTTTVHVAYANSGVNLHKVTFTLPAYTTEPQPSSRYVINDVVGPDGWVLTRVSENEVVLDADCDHGVVAGTPADFQVTLTATLNDSDAATPLLEAPIGVQAETRSEIDLANGPLCGAGMDDMFLTGTDLSAPVVVTPTITGGALPTSVVGPGQSTTLTWTITNPSTGARTVALTRTPSGNGTGYTETCTGEDAPIVIPAGGTRLVACTYSFTASGSYSFSAEVGFLNATHTRTATVTVEVGTGGVAWDHPAVVVGRPSRMTVVNGSTEPVTEVQVVHANSTAMAVSSASGTNGLTTCSVTATTVVCTGSLPAGQSSTLDITYSPLDGFDTTRTSFTVVVTAGSPSSTTIADYPVVVPLPDVAGLGILDVSTPPLQRLDWTGVEGLLSQTGLPLSPQAGVVVFRADDGVVPDHPNDFQRYQVGVDAGVVLARADVAGPAYFEDTVPPGRYRYRVCTHDEYYVYSDCSTGYYGAGWLDSAAPLAGGWTRQLGMDARKLVGMLPGVYAAAISNQDVTPLDLSTGRRLGAPISLSGVPSLLTAGTLTTDGRYLAFVATEDGGVNGINVATGVRAWDAVATGHPFVAGITGITRSLASDTFRTNYSMDILLIPSTDGNIVAIDAVAGGQPLWTLQTGHAIHALPIYDRETDLLIVPHDGGITAYDMDSSSSAAPPSTTSWEVPSTSGFTVRCARTTVPAYIACVDDGGLLQVLDKATGLTDGQPISSFETGVTAPAPSSLSPMSGATPGFVVGNAHRLVRVNATDATLTSLIAGPEWTAEPTLTLSPVLNLSSNGYLIVAEGSRLIRFDSELLTQTGQSPELMPHGASHTLGAVSRDLDSGFFIIGTSEGRLWAVPLSSIQ